MNSPEPAAEPAATGMSTRRRNLTVMTVVVVLAVLAWALYWLVHGRWYVTTDDSYVGATVVQITAEIPGTIRTIHPHETESVRAGQPLIDLDSADARIALDAALADLGSTVRQVRASFVQVDRARAQLAAREVELRRARADLARRNPIAAGGAISAEELAHARENIDGLAASVDGAREELNLALTQTRGTTVEQHPLVARAAARVRDAALTLNRTHVNAPVDAVVAKKSVQVGQRVTPGLPLMAIVPLDDVWVDANFKEVQLEHMRIGQPVILHADQYGSDVTFHGRIHGFSPGTGAAFALLPAQNASGNWIKIVQRVPVRIALDPKEVHEHPLRIGLSVHTEVEVRDQSGPVLASPTTSVAASMPGRPDRDPAIEAMIARIIAENGGHAATK